MSRHGCIDINGNVIDSHTPCSSPLSTTCCPDSYECRENGLCTLPAPIANANTNIRSRNGSDYKATEVYGAGLMWAQIPSCSLAKWKSCKFTGWGGCSSDLYAGFIPNTTVDTTICTSNTTLGALDTLIKPPDWLDCSETESVSKAPRTHCTGANLTVRDWSYHFFGSTEQVGTGDVGKIIAGPNRPSRLWPDPNPKGSGLGSTSHPTIPHFTSASVTAVGGPTNLSDSYPPPGTGTGKMKPMPMQTLIIITMTILVIGLLIPCYVLAHTRRWRNLRGSSAGRDGSPISLNEVYVGSGAVAGGERVYEEVPPPYKARESVVEPPPPCYHEDASSVPSGTGNDPVDGTRPGAGSGAGGSYLWPEGRSDAIVPAEPAPTHAPDNARDGTETGTGTGPDGRFVWPEGRRV